MQSPVHRPQPTHSPRKTTRSSMSCSAAPVCSFSSRPVRRPARCLTARRPSTHRPARLAPHGLDRRHRLRPHRALYRRQAAAISPHARVLEQVRRTLRFHRDTLPNTHGFFYHFTDLETGEPFRGSEISSIDTSLLLCGVLTARAHFHHDAKSPPRHRIYKRVDWTWMSMAADISMGLAQRRIHRCPLEPLLRADDDLLARPRLAHASRRSQPKAGTHGPARHAVQGVRLHQRQRSALPHQYSHAWFDFRHKRDKYANYFTNSITSDARSSRPSASGSANPTRRTTGASSASDSQHGYTAWGGPGCRTRAGEPVDIEQRFRRRRRLSRSLCPCRLASFSSGRLPARSPCSQGKLRRQSLGTLRILRRLPP